MVLFDEIEKAHPDVWNALLQILEDGRLTDGHGHTVDFTNTVIIMTSNIGTAFGPKGGTLGFRQRGDQGTFDDTRLKGEIQDSLRKYFRPEFLNRIDEIIIFHALTREHIARIVDIQLRHLVKLLKRRDVTMELTNDAKMYLADKGFDPVFGARPLKRAIQRELQDPLASALLEGQVHDGDHIVVDFADDELMFTTVQAQEA